MNNFIFRVTPHYGIHVDLNGKLISIQNWHDEMTMEENVLAAEAGRQLKEALC